jgi:hypothetical protein
MVRVYRPYLVFQSLNLLTLLLPVHPQKANKIDLNVDYPCPCHRRGRLTPITLTEAFGCNRCARFFVVQENGYVIEELPTNYSYKRTWRWTGNQWNIVSPPIAKSYLPLILGVLSIITLLLIAIVAKQPIRENPALWVIVLIVLSLVLFMAWLASRR